MRANIQQKRLKIIEYQNFEIVDGIPSGSYNVLVLIWDRAETIYFKEIKKSVRIMILNSLKF